jgi:hypothetical protein
VAGGKLRSAVVVASASIVSLQRELDVGSAERRCGRWQIMMREGREGEEEKDIQSRPIRSI